MIKFTNIQQVRVNGRKTTYADRYELINNTWIFQSRESVDGWYKTATGFSRKLDVKF